MGFIDADAHVDETEQTWEYMPPEDTRFKPASFTLEQQESFMHDARQNRVWIINGQARLRRFRDDKVTGTTRDTRELIDVDARLRHMDELGIDVQVLYPTTFLHAATDRPEVELALFKTYNRWLADRTANSGGRLRWVCLSPALSIDKAVEELRFAKEHGACGVLKKGVECGDRGAADPYFYPLYEEAERLDLPICFHQGDGRVAQSNAGDGVRLQELFVLSAFEQLSQQRVPDRFPNLRFGFIETGASWLPYMLKSLGMRGRAAAYGFDFKTEFLAHNRFFVTCDTEDDLPYLLQFGADNLMIGTDYSHADQSAEIRAHRVLVERSERGELSATAVLKVTSDNARRFYGL